MEDRSELYGLGQQFSSARFVRLAHRGKLSLTSGWNGLKCVITPRSPGIILVMMMMMMMTMIYLKPTPFQRIRGRVLTTRYASHIYHEFIK